MPTNMFKKNTYIYIYILLLANVTMLVSSMGLVSNRCIMYILMNKQLHLRLCILKLFVWLAKMEMPTLCKIKLKIRFDCFKKEMKSA